MNTPEMLDRARKLQALVQSFQSAVINSAKKAGYQADTFADALLALPADTVRRLHYSFREQAEAIKKSKSEEA